MPNRALFREKLAQALRDVKPGEQLAVLYIDIDEFKSVNDALGHAIGDELLKAVAEHLRNCLNETDVAARLGGDEFAVIQTAIKNRSETIQFVERIYRAIRAPFDCNGHLIATDAMDMEGLAREYGSAESAIRAIEAGVDVLLMPRNPGEAIDAVVKAVTSKRLTAARIDPSLRIVFSARMWCSWPCSTPRPIERSTPRLVP